MIEAPALLVRRVRRHVEDYGLYAAGKRMLAGSVEKVYRHTKYRIYRIDLARQPTPQPEPGAEFTLAELRRDDVSTIAQIENQAEWLRGQLGDRLENGSICIVAMCGQRVAGFNLISFGELLVPAVNLMHDFRKDAWSENITVHRDFRKKGLAEQIRLRAFHTLVERGVRKFYGGTLPSNAAALQLAKKLGFKEIAEVEYWKLLTREWRRYWKVDGVLRCTGIGQSAQVLRSSANH